jgi:hypothetical protein
MAELRAWLLAKLLWNPSLDPGALRQEFLKGYYGLAADRVAEFLAILEEALHKAGDPLGCYSPVDAKFLSLDTMIAARHSLEKAERKAAGTSELVRRVRRARLPVEYVVLSRWDEFRKEAGERNLRWPWPPTREELLTSFLRAARSEDVTWISEGQSLEDWAAKGGRKS